MAVVMREGDGWWCCVGTDERQGATSLRIDAGIETES